MPQRIILIRHGQSKDNKHPEYHHQLADPDLTKLGKEEASAWEGKVNEFNVDVVLVSPLKRTVQTACLVFAKSGSLPRELCRCAREYGWKTPENTITSTPEELLHLLQELPHGSNTTKVHEALEDDSAVQQLVDSLRECEGRRKASKAGGESLGDTEAEAEVERISAKLKEYQDHSVQKLLETLRGRKESTVAVVCHGGTIGHVTNHNCHAHPGNCELFDCIWDKDGKFLEVKESHQSPYFEQHPEKAHHCTHRHHRHRLPAGDQKEAEKANHGAHHHRHRHPSGDQKEATPFKKHLSGDQKEATNTSTPPKQCCIIS